MAACERAADARGRIVQVTESGSSYLLGKPDPAEVAAQRKATEQQQQMRRKARILCKFGFGLFLAAAWTYCFVLIDQDKALVIGGFKLQRREKLLVLVPISILIVTLTGVLRDIADAFSPFFLNVVFGLFKRAPQIAFKWLLRPCIFLGIFLLMYRFAVDLLSKPEWEHYSSVYLYCSGLLSGSRTCPEEFLNIGTIRAVRLTQLFVRNSWFKSLSLTEFNGAFYQSMAGCDCFAFDLTATFFSSFVLLSIFQGRLPFLWIF